MTEATAPTRPRAAHLGPDQRRPALIDHAASEFAAHGYRGASLRTIATRAGITKAVIYDCFPAGKSELFAAVVERARARFSTMVIEAAEAAPSGASAAVGAAAGGLARFLEVEPFALRLLIGTGTETGEEARVITAARERVLAATLALVSARLGGIKAPSLNA